MKYIVVDIEADGPIPGKYSMISLGAVDLDNFSNTFYGELKPISDQFDEKALRVSGFTREETLQFRNPRWVMYDFDAWVYTVAGGDHPLFVSDNAGFDWGFVNYYYWSFLGHNRFGHSSLSITSLYKGFSRTMKASIRSLRKTVHSHNALDDAIGNAEALQTIRERGMLL